MSSVPRAYKLRTIAVSACAALAVANSQVHYKALHPLITESATLSSDGLNAFLIETLPQTLPGFGQAPLLVAQPPSGTFPIHRLIFAPAPPGRRVQLDVQHLDFNEPPELAKSRLCPRNLPWCL